MQITLTGFKYVKVIPWGMKSERLPELLQNGLSKASKAPHESRALKMKPRSYISCLSKEGRCSTPNVLRSNKENFKYW